jgi:hypothetical protein
MKDGVAGGGESARKEPQDCAVQCIEANVVASTTSPDGSRAVVLIRGGDGRLIQRFCIRHADGDWRVSDLDPASSAGMGSWSGQFSSEHRSGVLVAAGDVADSVREVAISWRGDVLRVSAQNGTFLAVWWDVPEAAIGSEGPQIVRMS